MVNRAGRDLTVTGTLGGATVPADTLYRFSETSGTNALDTSGNGRNATLQNGTARVAGPMGGAVQFDGADDFVLAPTFPIGGGAVSIAVWVNSSDPFTLTWNRVFDFGDAAGVNNFLLAFPANTGQMAIHVYNGGGFQGQVTTPSVFPANTWVHVAAVVDGLGYATIYWNGVPQVRGSVGVVPNVARVNQFIGKSNWPGDALFAGMMDDFRIYSRALSETEVVQLASGVDVSPAAIGMTKSGNGTLILNGAYNCSGGITIGAGTLEGSSSSLRGNIANNASLVFNQTSNGGYMGAISGTGSLTKLGAGKLTLSGVNTYSGATLVSAGTLGVANPGLLEGRVNGAFDLAQPNPATSQQLMPRYGNITDFAPYNATAQAWADNTTFIYSGYINNPTAGNVTYTFAENFDDSTRLAIDGNQILFDGTWNIATQANYTLTPGLHPFELRLGEGGGGVGPGDFGGWMGTGLGFGFDPQGRNQPIGLNYQYLVDPGDGSVYMASLNANGIPDGSALTIAAGATLDLGGMNESIASLSGAGNVTTSGGTLTIAGSASTTFAGIISGSGGLAMSGTGTLALTNSHTYTGTTTVNGGTLRLSGANGAVNNSSALILGAGGTFDIDNTAGTTSRISDTASITFNGGTLSMATAAGSPRTETVGGLVFNSGASAIILTPNATGDVQLISSSFTRNGSATFDFVQVTAAPETSNLFTGGIADGTFIPYATVNSGPAIYTLANGLVNPVPKVTVANGAWENGANWNPAGVPAAADDVIIRHNITVNGSTTVRSMGFDTGSPLLDSTGPTVLTVSSGLVSCTGSAAPTVSLALNASSDWKVNQVSSGVMTISGAVALTSLSPVGAWNFDEASGTAVSDVSGNSNNGTLVNGVTRVAGRTGAGALQFDGIAGYVDVPGFAWPNGGGPVTVSYWNYVGSDVRTSWGFGVGNDNGNRFSSHSPWVDSTLYWDYPISGNGRTTAAYGPYLNKWTHVTLVSEGNAGAFRGIYFDGVLVSSVGVSDGPDTALSGLQIGHYAVDGVGTNQHKGMVDDFRIYNRVLPSSEVAALVAGNNGGFTKNGSGTLVLSGPNTYSGVTQVNAGVLQAAHSSALGAAIDGTKVQNGAALELIGGITIGNETLTVAGTGIGGTGAVRNISGINSLNGLVTLTGNTQVNVDLGADNLTLGGGITGGTSALTKAGPGTLILGGASSYSGGTTISAGTLQGTTSSLQGTIVNNGALVIDQTTTGTLVASISGTGTLTKSGTGTAGLYGTNSYSGTTTVSAGTLKTGVSPIAGTLVWLDATDVASITKDGANQVSQWNDKSGAGNNVAQGTLSRQPTHTAGALNGLPVMRFLSAQNDMLTTSTNFPAPATVIYVGRLNGGSNQRLVSSVNNNWLLGYWGSFRDQAYFEGWVNGPGPTGAGTAAHIYTGIIAGGGQNSSIYADGNLVAFNQGGVTGPNGLALGGWGNSTEFSDGDVAEVFVFNSALSDANRREVEAYLSAKWFGSVIGGDSLPNNSAVTVAAGATLDLSSGNETIGSLAGGGNVVLGASLLTSGGDNSSTLFSGVISGTGALQKLGTGVQTLSGANTYTGTTTASSGSLLVDGSMATVFVTVASGATLGGTGTIAGIVTVDGTLAPGDGGGGTLTVNGNVNFNSGSTFSVELDGVAPSDQLRAGTGVTLAANVTFSATLGAASSHLQVFTVVDKTSLGAVSGTFTGIANNSVLTIGGRNFVFKYDHGAGTNNIALIDNNAPVASNMSPTTNEDTALPLNLVANDPDLDALTYTIVSNPTNGVLSGFNAATGAVTYTPNANYNGPDSFTFSVSDGLLTSNTATVSITVTAVNDQPTATAQSVTVLEESFVNITLAGVDNDPEVVQTLTFAIGTGPANGLLSGFNAATGAVTYTPNADYFGPDSFTFTVTDDNTAGGAALTSAAATVTITVTAVNDVPSFVKGADQTVAEDPGAQNVAGWATAISAGPVNEGGQTLTFLVSNNNNPLFSVQPAVSAAGILTYTPAPNANGTAIVTVSLQDNGGILNGGVDTSASQTFNITVTPVNDTPVANAQLVNTAEGVAVTITLTADDGDPEVLQVLTYALVTQTTNGTLSNFNAATGTVTYTPNALFNGTDSFTFVLTDDGTAGPPANLTSTAATVTIAVGSQNNQPTANSQSLVIGTDKSVAITLTGDDQDPEVVQALTFTITIPPSNGRLTGLNPATGTVTYAPNPGFVGTDSFSFTITDDATAGPTTNLVSAAATVTISVTPAPSFNSDPTVTPDAVIVGQPVVFNAGTTGTSTIVWDFGDGSSATGGTVTHTYVAPGIYTVTVTATSPQGVATSFTTTVFVSLGLSTGGSTTLPSGATGILVGGAGQTAAQGGSGKLVCNFVRRARTSAAGSVGSINFPTTLKQADLIGQPGILTLGRGALAQTFVFTLDKRGRGRATSLPKIEVSLAKKRIAFKANNRAALTDLAESIGANYTRTVKKGPQVTVMLPATLQVGNQIYLAMTFQMLYHQIGTSGKAGLK